LASSSEEEDRGEDGEVQLGDSSFPQLVMPSIQMPTRRPFTANGRAMGKLKVLIAGAAGIYSVPLLRVISTDIGFRCGKDIAHTLYRPNLRRHHPRRPLLAIPVLRLLEYRSRAQAKASKHLQRKHYTHHRDQCKYQNISAVVE
jgi:hypothetical protein